MVDTRVKICGITTPHDAAVSQSLGADYLGLIFAESPRRISLPIARAIRRAVPTAMLVGVFVDAPIEDVAEICDAGVLNMVQLHGKESPAYCNDLFARISLPLIKAFGVGHPEDPDGMKLYRHTGFFLFDLDKTGNGSAPAPATVHTERLWNEAANARRKGYRIFLGGALTVGNVRSAIRQVEPYCIDVASGVESSPGVKDHDAIRRFLREVKG